MAELSDVVEVIEITNAKLGDIELKIDDMKLLMDNQALHNINEELFFVELNTNIIDISTEVGLVKNEMLTANQGLVVVHENLIDINNEVVGMWEQVNVNNDWYYNQISEINTKISYSFVFLGIIAGLVMVFIIVSLFLKRLR